MHPTQGAQNKNITRKYLQSHSAFIERAPTKTENKLTRMPTMYFLNFWLYIEKY